MADRHHGVNEAADPRRQRRGLEGAPRAQKQPWPGRSDAMSPRPDHGEESYRGAGKLEGRRALITGGDSGIGRAVAIAFAREGADVAIVHYDEEDDAEETLRWVREAGRQGVSRRADLADRETCGDVVAWAVEELGGLDILVNNAAYQCEVEFEELSDEQIERTFRSNILACIHLARFALPHLEEGGVILNMGSMASQRSISF